MSHGNTAAPAGHASGAARKPAKATMYPAYIPHEVKRNILREAECKVYDCLRQLPAGYAVFYSRPWLGLTPEGREIEGEADFVVAHPDNGILVIEVKGGGIRHDARAGEWISVDRFGIPHPIRNPVEQARSSKYQLLKKLKVHGSWTPRFIRAAHAVVFTDAVSPPDDLGADMPRGLFACRDEMPALSEWVQSRMRGPVLDGADEDDEYLYSPLGEDGVDALVDLIARSFELPSPLADAVEAGERRVLVATREQYDVLDGLEANRRCVIAGAAGTGKTYLAIEKARRLAREGSRTLLTCCSRPLAAHLQRRTEAVDGLTIAALSDLPGLLLQGGGGRVPVGGGTGAPDSPDAVVGNSTLTDQLIAAVEASDASRLFDAVVVDEGQDLRADWWAALELCMREPKAGHLYVFHDDNQRVYGGQPVWPDDLVPYALTRNLRNSKTIWAQSMPFYGGRRLHSGGPDGRLIEWVPLASGSDLRRVLAGIVTRLTGEDQLKPDALAILARDIPAELAAPGVRLAGIPLSRAEQGAVGEIVLETVAGFKGLEKPVVMLIRPEEMIDDPELMYVGITRARQHLIIVGRENTLKLIEGMPAAKRA